MRRLAPWVAVAVYQALIFYLSSQPDPLPALTASMSDKVLHGIEYGGLGLLLAAALRASGVGARRAWLLAFAGASLYGASDELHQLFVPGRSCEALDWLADTVGGAAGASVLTGATRTRARRAASVPLRPSR